MYTAILSNDGQHLVVNNILRFRIDVHGASHIKKGSYVLFNKQVWEATTEQWAPGLVCLKEIETHEAATTLTMFCEVLKAE